MIKTILVIILILLLCFFIFNNVETFVGVDLLNDFYFDNTVNINDKSINARRICIFKRNSSNTKVEDHECIDANQLLSTLKLDESRKKLVCLDNNCLNKSDIRLLNGSDSFKLKNKYWSTSCVGGYADVKLKRCGHGQKISWLPQFVGAWWYNMRIKSSTPKSCSDSWKFRFVPGDNLDKNLTRSNVVSLVRQSGTRPPRIQFAQGHD